MRKWITAGVAAAALFAGAALAEEVTGTVESIDMTDMKMTVDGQEFYVSPENVVGDKLDALAVGDTVRVTYQQNGGAPSNEINAMTVDKVE